MCFKVFKRVLLLIFYVCSGFPERFFCFSKRQDRIYRFTFFVRTIKVKETVSGSFANYIVFEADRRKWEPGWQAPLYVCHKFTYADFTSI